jgi:serine/threonine-protein kinase
MSNDRLPVPEGTVLDGKYQVGRLLGRGGMGVVMAAHHLLLDTEVALKFLTATEPELVARFSREARAAARIQSEHVTRVLDVGALANGAPFMVMECLAGEDLSQILARGPLPPVEAVDYVLQACEAIAEAHALGIVHRDLKPANLFLTRRAHGRSMIKVLDFGISRGGARGMPTLTGSGLLGSPQYMSPEQWTDSRAVDSRSDLWSLGVVLYEMIAGRRPFDGESFPAIFTAIANDAPPPLPPGLVPAGLEEAVARCLEKEKSRRFQDVASLARAIGPFGSPASRPLLDRIAHFGTFRRTAIADTAPVEIPAGGDAGAASRAEAAVAAMDLPVGGTVALPSSSSSNFDPPRAGDAAVAGRPSTAAKPARSTSSPRKPAAPPPSSAVPVKVISLGLAVVGAIAVVAVIIVRVVASDHGKRSSAAEAVTPSPSPVPTPAPPAAASRPAVVAAPPVEEAPAEKETPPNDVGSKGARALEAKTEAKTVARTEAKTEGKTEGKTAPKPEATKTAAVRERPRPPSRAPDASKARLGAQWSAACSRLLARQSLGENLSKEDMALYMRECRR